MLARFTKRPDGRHRLTVVRDHGGVSQSQMVPGLGAEAIPHDLLHTLVEKTLGFERGVYGMVNTGLDLAELLDPAQKRTNKAESELMLSEVITTLLQGEAAYVGVGENEFRGRLQTQCEEHGIAPPMILDDELRRLRSLRDDYQRRWRQLEAGETIEVELRPRTSRT